MPRFADVEARSSIRELLVPDRAGVPRESGRAGSRTARACRRGEDPAQARSVRRTAPRPRNGGSSLAVAMEDVQHRPLRAVGVFAVVVAVVRVAAEESSRRRRQPRSLAKREDTGQRRFRDDREVDAAGRRARRRRRADRAERRTKGTGLRRAADVPSPARPARAVVAGVAREHEAVDDERVLAGREQLGQPTSVGLPSAPGPRRRSPPARHRRAAARAARPRPPPSPGAARSPARATGRAPPGTPATLLETRASPSSPRVIPSGANA